MAIFQWDVWEYIRMGEDEIVKLVCAVCEPVFKGRDREKWRIIYSWCSPTAVAEGYEKIINRI